MKAKIAEWLEKHHFAVNEFKADGKLWAYQVQSEQDFRFVVGVDERDPDIISFALKMPMHDYLTALSSLSIEEKNAFLFGLRFKLIDQNIAFSIPDHELGELIFVTYVLEEELTRKNALDAVDRLHKVAQITMWWFEWKLERPDVGIAP